MNVEKRSEQAADSAGDLDLMRNAVKDAGQLALEFFGDRANDKWQKDDGSFVSDADMALDKLLHQRLLEGRQGYGWLSEETEDDLVRLSKSHVWIVDPIDGTRAFIHDKPHWVVSVALVVDGVVRMGCLYNPVKEEFFEAVLGGGAKLNGQKMLING